MKSYVILADLTCDLTEEIRTMIGMEDYIKGHININGKETLTSLDWKTVSRETFYRLLSDKKTKITTAPPNLEEYYEAFRSWTEKGYAVISMSISSGISGTYNFACHAAERVKAEYPDSEIYCFDSFRMSGGFGLLVIYAHLLKQQGKSYDEVIAWLEENKCRVHQMGPIDDLFFIARRGRLTMGKGIMGSFAGVKPMGDCNENGYVTVLTKVKGISKALDTTVAYVKASAVGLEDQTLLVCHSNREMYAKTLKEKLEQALSPKQVLLTEVFAGCGANVGPGMIGVYYLGNKVSDELCEEKAIMNAVIGK